MSKDRKGHKDISLHGYLSSLKTSSNWEQSHFSLNLGVCHLVSLKEVRDKKTRMMLFVEVLRAVRGLD